MHPPEIPPPEPHGFTTKLKLACLRIWSWVGFAPLRHAVEGQINSTELANIICTGVAAGLTTNAILWDVIAQIPFWVEGGRYAESTAYVVLVTVSMLAQYLNRLRQGRTPEE